MTTPALSQHGRAFINTVIVAYDTGLSYEGVARKLDSSTTTVQSIMRRHAPDSIRSGGEQVKVRPRIADEGLTLKALGQSNVGLCRSCGIPLVAKIRKNPVTGQTCGLCLDFASGGGPVRKVVRTA